MNNEKHFVCVTVGDQWKVVADRLGLRVSEIQFLDERYRNPSEPTLEYGARRYGMNVDDLYDVLTECEIPILADIFLTWGLCNSFSWTQQLFEPLILKTPLQWYDCWS